MEPAFWTSTLPATKWDCRTTWFSINLLIIFSPKDTLLPLIADFICPLIVGKALHMEQYTDADFEEKVIKADKLTVVDFWAEWCAPCRMIGPIIEELSTEYGDKINIGKLNVDENSQVATKYGIRSIPTILFFKNGEIAKQVVGVRTKAELQEVIDGNI